MSQFVYRDGPWRCLPGWFNYGDLYEKAVEISEDGDTLVEIGVAFGRSLSYLAQCVRESKKDLRIIAVDPFQTDLDVWGAEYADWAVKVGGPLEAFRLLVQRHDPDLWKELHITIPSQNVHRAPREHVLYVGLNEDIVSRFTDGECSFVFIDGDHRFDAVKKDCELWEPKVRDGGILSGHDFTPGDSCGEGVVRYVSKAYPKAEIWNTSWVHHIVKPKSVANGANALMQQQKANQANYAAQLQQALNERLP